jgi:hypothetical protein
MVDRLRGFLNLPLRDADRPRMFAVAVALIVGATAILALLDDAGSSPARRPPDASTSPAPDRSLEPPPPATAATATEEPPSEEGKPPAALEASRRDVEQAKRAARRFLVGYLPYSYGGGQAHEIENASADLRQRLARERPRVPRQEARRRPRLVLLHADGAGRERAGMVALVSDGARRYTVALELARTVAGWRVIDVGS